MSTLGPFSPAHEVIADGEPLASLVLAFGRCLQAHIFVSQRRDIWHLPRSCCRQCIAVKRHTPLEDGERFLLLDLDVRIHQDLKYFFELPMDKPWIVRGWWNDPDTVKRNFSKHKSTPLNSSVIRWDRGQLKKVYNHIDKNAEVIFFTYPSADNYFNHHWYNVWNEDKGFFRGFPQKFIHINNLTFIELS